MDGMGWDVDGWDGMDGMGCDGMGWDGMDGMDGMGWVRRPTSIKKICLNMY